MAPQLDFDRCLLLQSRSPNSHLRRGDQYVDRRPSDAFQRCEAASSTIWLPVEPATNRIPLQHASTGRKIARKSQTVRGMLAQRSGSLGNAGQNPLGVSAMALHQAYPSGTLVEFKQR